MQDHVAIEEPAEPWVRFGSRWGPAATEIGLGGDPPEIGRVVQSRTPIPAVKSVTAVVNRHHTTMVDWCGKKHCSSFGTMPDRAFAPA